MNTSFTPIGDTVLCDLCNKDWTNSPTSGGFIFESKAVCPDCTPDFRRSIERHNEQRCIGEVCTGDSSFADFVREYRGPNAGITITTFSKEP